MRAGWPLLLIVNVAVATFPTSLAAPRPFEVQWEYSFPGGARQELNITIFYDTSAYSSKFSWYLPDSFVTTGVVDDYGPVAFTTDSADSQLIRFETHYTRGGYRSVSIFARSNDAQQIAPGVHLARAFAAPLKEPGSQATLVLSAPEGGTILLANGSRWATWAESTETSLSRHYVFADEAAWNSLEYRIGGHYALLFPANATSEEVDRIERAARMANTAFPTLEARFRDPATSASRFVVIFAPDSLFDWESGWMDQGFVAVRMSDYRNASGAQNYYRATVLVHETAHALLAEVVGAHAGRVPAWVDEGSAHAAEVVIEQHYPTLVVECRRGFMCQNLSQRLDYTHLLEYYRGERTFDPAWNPDNPQSAEARRLAYEYNGYLIEQYIATYGRTAYLGALARMGTDLETAENCEACGVAIAEQSFRLSAGNASSDSIYLPHADLFTHDRAAFQDIVRDEVVMERSFAPHAVPSSGPPLAETVGAEVLADGSTSGASTQDRPDTTVDLPAWVRAPSTVVVVIGILGYAGFLVYQLKGRQRASPRSELAGDAAESSNARTTSTHQGGWRAPYTKVVACSVNSNGQHRFEAQEYAGEEWRVCRDCGYPQRGRQL